MSAGRVGCRVEEATVGASAISGLVSDRDVSTVPYAATMSERPLTLMAVHAHPDDEASSTGGILAKYGQEGVRTVLVPAPDGELGNAADGSARARPATTASA